MKNSGERHRENKQIVMEIAMGIAWGVKTFNQPANVINIYMQIFSTL